MSQDVYLGTLTGLADDYDDFDPIDDGDLYAKPSVMEDDLSDEGDVASTTPRPDFGDLELEVRLRTTPGDRPRTPEEIEEITQAYYREQEGLGL